MAKNKIVEFGGDRFIQDKCSECGHTHRCVKVDDEVDDESENELAKSIGKQLTWFEEQQQKENQIHRGMNVVIASDPTETHRKVIVIAASTINGQIRAKLVHIIDGREIVTWAPLLELRPVKKRGLPLHGELLRAEHEKY
jgi:hypothetical protein